MSFRNFINRLKDQREELERTREEDALRIAFDLTGQIKLRIQSRGEDFNDDPFSPYTPGYAETRDELGFQSDYVDLTRSGQLWANVRPVVIDKTQTTVSVEIGAQSPANEVKVRGFVRKRPNPMRPSQAEIQRAQDAYFQLRSNRLQ